MKYFKFGLRSLLMFVTLIALLAAYLNYRAEASKPDLSVSARDVAWAADIKVWKVDLTNVGDFFGVAIVTIKAGDLKNKKHIMSSGGHSLMDATQCPVAQIGMSEFGESVEMKLHCGGAGVSSKVDKFFQKGSRAFAANPPIPDGDFVYLASDSKTVGAGAKPFDKGSNVIALEILRKPMN